MNGWTNIHFHFIQIYMHARTLVRYFTYLRWELVDRQELDCKLIHLLFIIGHLDKNYNFRKHEYSLEDVLV